MSNDQPLEPAPPTPPAAPVPGWYPDPADATRQRYWDGAAWSPHTHPLVSAPAWPTAAPGASAPLYGAAGYAGTGYAVPAGYAASPRQVGFREAVSRAFAGWKDYSGRATVGEYWWFYLFQMLVTIVPYVILMVLLFAAVPGLSTTSSGTSGTVTQSQPLSGALVAVLVVVGILYLVLAIVLFVVHLAVAVRRLHDTDREGLWYLISFVPFGSIVLLVFMVMAGTPGPNRYGPVPT